MTDLSRAKRRLAVLRRELLDLVKGVDTTLADQIRDLILNLDEGLLDD